MSELDDAVAGLSRAPHSQAAWQRLFALTWPYVVALAHQYNPVPRNFADAEDLAQEVFLKFSRAWHAGTIKVSAGGALRALLAVMTRRLAIDRARRRRSRPTPEFASKEIGEAPADDVSETEWNDMLEIVCCGLDDDLQKVLMLRLEGYTVPEIAEKMAVSARSIERKLFVLRRLVESVLPLDG